MPSPASIRAPQTLVVINRVNTVIASRDITREKFMTELNELICGSRKLRNNYSGLQQVFRWLDPTSDRWSEPKSEIVLSMLKWLEIHE